MQERILIACADRLIHAPRRNAYQQLADPPHRGATRCIKIVRTMGLDLSILAGEPPKLWSVPTTKKQSRRRYNWQPVAT